MKRGENRNKAYALITDFRSHSAAILRRTWNSRRLLIEFIAGMSVAAYYAWILLIEIRR